MIAIVRDIPTTFACALCAAPPHTPIDVARARAQHAAYRTALGVPVTLIAADDTLPDCCFVEDTAVIAAGIALITRLGAPTRRAETAAVETALTGLVEVVTMEEPATLDGGDCMQVGNTIFVGRSARTNDAGIARL